MENAVYAITALRWQGSEIEEAMMGLLDTERMQWDRVPAPTRTSIVIDHLLEGEPVLTWLPQGHARGHLGSVVNVDLLPGGRETLSLADERSGARLQDLPRY